MDDATVAVSYLELRAAPVAAPQLAGDCQVLRERLTPGRYLELYRRVGAPVGWDQRLRMPAAELAALLASARLSIHVLRDRHGAALGLCEFDRAGFPEVELTNFGVVPEAQGRGRGPWLLAIALAHEWRAGPTRIWLHTDTWDHPAAIPVYRRAGFRVYDVRQQPVADL
jgi:ribosomal protein S18 acetylase RimI-like enzyme